MFYELTKIKTYSVTVVDKRLTCPEVNRGTRPTQIEMSHLTIAFMDRPLDTSA